MQKCIAQCKCKEVLLENNKQMERAEVLLSNLLALKRADDERFTVPMDDVLVTLDTAIILLRN